MEAIRQALAALQPNPYAVAVRQAQQEYPALKGYPLSLTFNPERARNSETFPPTEGANPLPGRWNIEMGRAPYATRSESWPELVGLEGLHTLEAEDPRYQALTQKLAATFGPERMAAARQRYALDKQRFGVTEPFETYLQHVYVPEVIRGQLWGDLFHKYEGAPSADVQTRGYTPQEREGIDVIGKYLRGIK